MATNVTVLGAGGAIVTIPIGSAANAAAAQLTLNTLSQLVSSGKLTQINNTDLPLPNSDGVVVNGAGGNLGVLPANYLAVVSNATGPLSLVGNTNANDTVVSGMGGLNFTNNGTNTQVFAGGGTSILTEGSPGASGVFGIDGVAAIDVSQGASTINVNDGALISVVNNGLGTATVFAQPGFDVIGNFGTSAVATTVMGTAGSRTWYVPSSGDAFINPGAGNITVFAGGGSTTLFGGTAALGGGVMTAPAFTGAATVFGGTGYFAGGTAGDNILIGSTVTGATTLVGGGTGDQLWSHAGGDELVAGNGNETLVGAGPSESTSGDTFFGTSYKNSNTIIFGAQSGGNNIFVGAGAEGIQGNHGVAGGNVYSVLQDGGSATIGDFQSGTDVFSLTKAGGPDLQVSNLYAQGGGTIAQLSDGTTVLFANATVKMTDFKG